MLNNYLGFFAFILTAIGGYLSAKKNNFCWYLWLASNVIWSYYALRPYQPMLLAEQFVFFGLNVYGIVKWKK